jgi:hypothetical protein
MEKTFDQSRFRCCEVRGPIVGHIGATDGRIGTCRANQRPDISGIQL